MSTSDPAGRPFDAGRPYTLHPAVALRPERFGALAYHYGNRKLTFLKSPQLASIVGSIDEYDTVEDALTAHGIDDGARASYVKALAGLEASEVIGAR